MLPNLRVGGFDIGRRSAAGHKTDGRPYRLSSSGIKQCTRSFTMIIDIWRSGAPPRMRPERHRNVPRKIQLRIFY